METSNILKPVATTSATFTAKFGRFISSWLLTEVVLSGGVFKFLERLNDKGILGMGDDFQSTQLFWGTGVGMNIFRFVITVVFAGLFGLMYGYLSKRINTSEKIIVNTINALLAVFGNFFIMLVALFLFRPKAIGNFSNELGIILHTFTASPFLLSLLVLNFIGSAGVGFYFVGIGSKIISDPYHMMDKERTGTLLGIKWYHYLWLWVPISFYVSFALDLIYATGHALITFIKNVRWFDFLGMEIVSENGAPRQNSLDITWGKIFWIIMGFYLCGYLLAYLREVLSGEKEMHVAMKILVSLGIGIVIPFLLMWFLLLGR